MSNTKYVAFELVSKLKDELMQLFILEAMKMEMQLQKVVKQAFEIQKPEAGLDVFIESSISPLDILHHVIETMI